jgi:hypothetical protein
MKDVPSYPDLRAQLVCNAIYHYSNVLYSFTLGMDVGCAVVTLTDAFLFTDGRYFLQAEKQLDQSAFWQLLRWTCVDG